MNALLVRVGADRSIGGGSWNGPVDAATREFTYVAIPETAGVHPGLEKPYQALAPELAKFGAKLPTHLVPRHMHVDPDFVHLTYGDQGERAKQLRENLKAGDLILFYAALTDIRGAARLVYALIGIFVVERFSAAADVPPNERDINAHTRRVLKVRRNRSDRARAADRIWPPEPMLADWRVQGSGISCPTRSFKGMGWALGQRRICAT